MKAAARQYVAGQDFVGDPKALPIGDKLKALAAALDALEKQGTVTNADAAKAVQDAFGATVADTVANNALDAPMSRLRDSIIAIKLLPEEQGRSIEGLGQQLRDLELIVKIDAMNSFPGDGATLRRYRRRSFMLPPLQPLKPITSVADRQKEIEKHQADASAKRNEEAEAKLATFKQLRTAIEELGNLSSEHLQAGMSMADGGFLVPSNFRPVQLAMQEITQRQQLSQFEMLRARSTPETIASAELAARVAAVAAGSDGTEKVVGRRIDLGGNPAFRPTQMSDLGFRVRPEVARSLGATTAAVLKARNLSLADRPLDRVVESLQREKQGLSADLDGLYGRPVRQSFKRIGGLTVMVSTPLSSPWANEVVGLIPPLPPPPPSPLSVPQTHGHVAAAGVADLLIIKQQLVRYEGADVAHIEDILKGENKERKHTRRRTTEEITLRESETTTTEERELESTNRFEMSRETSETIKEDASLKAGLTVSGKYGPVVEFSASAEGSVSRSKEEATKDAAKFSQDVMQRSASKVTQRILERTSLRVTTEVTDENTHILDNIGGAKNISGVYQWVNKVYQAQMFNYGLRTLYEFMIPEPAAFLIAALQNAQAHAVALEKPAPFTLRADQIDEQNYNDWVLRYGVTDVAPPPEIYKTKALDFKAGGGDSNTNYNHSGQIAIEEGYRAIYGTVACVWDIWDDSHSIDLALGQMTHRINKDTAWLWSTPLSDERDSIPFALDTFHVSQVAAAVEVKCQRTDRAMVKWRLETHSKIMEAYKARLSEYEEKLANLQMQAGIAIQGRNPTANAELINDELRKHCITVLTEQHYDLFDAIDLGTNNLPQIDFLEAASEGAYVRFFEQAFEWEHLTWIGYPYFWGRKSEWEQRIAFDDSDPLFNQFLKAGYCRVVVPARPSFEGAIDHFMYHGEPWNGGPLPPISSPLYLPIADELAERLDRPGDETPQGDPWLVRIPTSLVHLRADDQLPSWQQQPDGTWLPS